MRTRNRVSGPRGAVALLTLLALLTLGSGCFGYTPSARRWAYVGDTVLVLGGGAAITADLLTSSEPCVATPTRTCTYEAPISGALVAGAVLVAAGLVGYIFNATRPTVTSSR